MSNHSHDHNGHNHAHDHNGHAHHNHDDHGHDHSSLVGELMCHFPYAVFSVAFGLIVVSFLDYISVVSGLSGISIRGANVLFHSFHFMHLAFAATGTLITFYRFSKNNALAFIVGLITPTFFCIMSDAVLPYLGGRLLGVDMSFHLCFYSELPNVLPFLAIGMLNGYVMSRHQESLQSFYSQSSHFIHILVSSLASTLYLVSHGFTNWYHSIGVVFLFLVVAVVVPCTLSDVVVPMAFARIRKKK